MALGARNTHISTLGKLKPSSSNVGTATHRAAQRVTLEYDFTETLRVSGFITDRIYVSGNGPSHSTLSAYFHGEVILSSAAQ